MRRFDITGGSVSIHGRTAGSVTELSAQASLIPGNATFTLFITGRFARFWTTSGATRAVVRAASRERPNSPMTFEGDIQQFTTSRLILINVKQTGGF